MDLAQYSVILILGNLVKAGARKSLFEEERRSIVVDANKENTEPGEEAVGWEWGPDSYCGYCWYQELLQLKAKNLLWLVAEWNKSSITPFYLG